MRVAPLTAVPAPIVLVAHGSRDPRAALATEALTRAVAAARPGLVARASYLDHGQPRPAAVLAELEAAGHRRAVLVPLLLTAAYHGKVDIPETVAAARSAGLEIPVLVGDVLGPTEAGVDPRLVAGLCRRLTEAGCSVHGDSDNGRVDGLVLAAAGTRDAAARRTVEEVAEALGAALAVPTRVGYASAAPPTAAVAVAGLRAGGARRVAVATYFLAPGRLYETAMASAREAGAVAFAAPLGDAPELARLVLARADATGGGSLPRVGMNETVSEIPPARPSSIRE
ncbi:sirohydrochlorin chelatase [Plantactinospora soyae]|uniref:Sirohydrochlorin ferrochelatase n=1 Tax=Plantactinospora soyae TaxID=1544732 RepID=A0A927QXV9_9ACTN|nr:CbiX/SirB N-terminal domain-containing protein [Plantactinospora soyae]MBE1487172.1 sirohydrochlorin ferrochelatase [Plantactinospora soyae]